MTTTITLLGQLKAKNISISLDDSSENLRIRGELSNLTDNEKSYIKENKAELIAFLKEQETKTESITKTATAENYPISDAQRRLWVLSQFKEGSIAYNMPAHYLLDSDVDIASFKKATEATIDRHEILRTVFKMDDNGEVKQWVLNRTDLDFDIDCVDLRNLKNKQKKVEEYIHRKSLEPFDLQNGPLLKMVLLRTDIEKYIFYFNMHHIISDGWSMDVLYHDLLTFYKAFSKGIEVEIPSLDIQYKDYAIWQTNLLGSDTYKAHRAYWLNKLSGKLGLLDLIGSKSRPAVKTHRGRTVITYLNKELAEKLKNYALAEEGTLFMSILSVLNALMHRYTGQEDVIIGTPIAGRSLRQLENQIGFYVNALALRTGINKTDSFKKIYDKIKQTTLDAFTHQMYPFDRLVEELNQNRQTSRSAIFDILVVLQNTGEKFNEFLISADKLDEIVQLKEGTCIYDIKFEFQEQGEYIKLLIEHNIDVYSPEMINALIIDFKCFSDLLLSNSERSINAIDYELIPEKYAKDDLNKTSVQLFQEQVEESKDKTALKFGENIFTYEQLNQQANQTAHFLSEEIGLKAEGKVGLLFNTGKMPIIATIAVLKAGGAYVILDEKMAESQLLSIINELEICAILTEKEFIEKTNRLQWLSNSLVSYSCLDSDDVRSEQEQHENVMMSQDLWDHVGRRAENHIASGGWLSSYTGEIISQQEMDEYSMNAYLKLKPILHKEMRVLEIGCSSGITLGKIAPEVAFYYGTDLSPVILSGTQQMIEDKGLNNVKLRQLIAHEVSEIDETNFDLIIINSVIQNFHGHNYLLDVIRKCIYLLTDQGNLFVGDVMDMNKKGAMISELEQFKIDNRDKGYTTKTDFSTDLFVSKGYFEDLVLIQQEIAEVQITEKIYTIENELTKFRYDVLLQIDKAQTGSSKGTLSNEPRRNKNQFDRSYIKSNSKENLVIKITPDQLAFVMTAAKNGSSNDIFVKHGEVFDWYRMNNKEFDFRGSQKWALFNCLDTSLFELYGALLFGAELVQVPNNIYEDTDALIDFIRSEKITACRINSELLASFETAVNTFNDASQICHLIVDGTSVNTSEIKEVFRHHDAFHICHKQDLISENFPTFEKVITAEEEEKIRLIFNDTNVDYPTDITFLKLFHENVNNNPDQVAVLFNEIELTYGELDEKSNQLAHYLQQKYSIHDEDLVGIKQDRNEWLLTSILGVLKAGAAYVPIDPNYPQERIKFIEEDTNCKICLDEEELNTFINERGNFSKEALKNTIISPNQLAYVIYTSGSTGRPKGVLIEHRSILNRLLWMKEDLTVVESDIFLQKTPITFDVSVWELFLPLIAGSKLVFALPGGHKDPAYIEQAMEKYQVSIIHFVPSLLRDALENIAWDKLNNLRHVVCSGEALPKKLETVFAQKVPSSSLHNYYGPTEAAIDVTKINLTKNPTLYSEVSIGKPVSNTKLYIVNEENKLQAIGEPGELLIGGVQVARGYLNHTELTEKKFVKNPFKTNETVYRTGDLAAWLPDGNIEFLGRRDDQVKIRGFRIELGEIEQALSTISAIDTAVVLAKENINNEKDLIVYLTAKEEQNADTLRSALKELLPDYMIPSIFVQLDEIPLTAHGKINKKILPDPAGFGMASGSEYVAPRNEIEEKLVAIWEAVLERKNIGVKDDFFALGGHSIKAVRLRNEYSKKLEVNLSLEDLFTYKTIESQRKLIQPAKKEKFVPLPSLLIDYTATDNQNGYPISDAQRRLWVLSQFDKGSVAYNMPTTVVLNGIYDLKNFRLAVEKTIERHEILRTVFKTDLKGNVWQQVLSLSELNFEIHYQDFRTTEAEAVSLYITADSYKAFDLQNGPLLRAALLQVSDEEYVFYYNMHHIISDGWSLGVLSKDVLTYYQALQAKKEADLKPLRIQYKDYATWQLSRLTENESKRSRDYWLDVLSGELPLLNLPSPKKRPRIKTSNGYGLGVFFDSNTTGKLKNYAEANGGSLFVGLLATWNILMYRYANQNDIIIGSSIAGREHADLEDQIGFYSNTIASRNQIKPEDNFTSFFKGVRDKTLKNFKHQSYPFIRLVEELNLKGDTSRNAIFDVMIFLQNNGGITTNLVLPEDQINVIIDQGQCPSKFDLNVGVQEMGNVTSMNFVFNTDVYERSMIENLIHHYRQLIIALVENPEKNLASIDILRVEEKYQLLEVFNNTNGINSKEFINPNLEEKTVLDLFENQAAKTPENKALSFGDKTLTYKQLNDLSNQLANYLRANHQINPDDIIGVLQNRSEWLIITILGIMKTGAAYLPIDPEDSDKRKEHIITDSGIDILITEIDFIHDVDYYEGEIVAIDIEFEPEDYSTDKPKISVTPDNLAYVIYTSGSTGKPKGVLNTLKGITDYTLGVIEKTNILECKSFGLVSTIAADLGNTVIYPSLITGGNLHVLAKEDVINASKLVHFDLDCIKMTPSHWKSLQIGERFFTPNKCLILGGETFSTEILNYLKRSQTECQVYNHYGPTETTVGKLIFKIDDHKNHTEIPLGKPIGNNQVYVLNHSLQLCPIGVTGEICISGVGVARGYLNQHDQTNTKFLINPFNSNERIYKTGDLGKWLPSGAIVFVGREDDQVKIRGYRIELGEIEDALLKQEELIDATVKVWRHENDEAKLVAYIVSKKEPNLTDLRAGLRKILPEYMLPAYYVELESLPLTSNGKVDKNALPNPNNIAVLSGTEYIAPRNEIEERIVEIISYIVGRPKNQISVYDNFFDLGISSLGLLKLYNSINDKLNVNLQVVSVFEFSTVNVLSGYISANLKADKITSAVGEVSLAEDISNDIDEMIDLI